MREGGTRAVALWHRRAGKDEMALHWAAVACMTKPATYWHMLPEATQARKAIWDAVNPHTGIRRIDEVFPLVLRSSTKEQEMMIKFKNGATWQVVGSDNFNSLVGSPPAGVVFSEWALANPSAWAYIRPILAENGGWAVFIYTARGRNHGLDTIEMAKTSKGWFHQVLTVDDTDVFTKEQLADELLEYKKQYGEQLGSALFRQEYYCSFDAAVMGSVYGEWMENAEKSGRFKQDIYDRSLPVHTAWDLGYDDATAIWFYQLAGKEVRLIDYYENNQQDIEHYCDVLKEKPYRYDKHYVPHDAANKLLAAGGKSIVEQAYKLGVKMYVIPATSQQNGISAARKTIETSWFDPIKCAKGIRALQNYQFEFDDKLKTFKSQPKHDYASHGCDAFEIIGQTRVNNLQSDAKPKPKFLHDLTADDVFYPKNYSNYKPPERI